MSAKKIKAIQGKLNYSLINTSRDNHDYRMGYLDSLSKIHDLVYNGDSNIKPMDILKKIQGLMNSAGAVGITIDIDSEIVDSDSIKIGGTIWVYAP